MLPLDARSICLAKASPTPGVAGLVLSKAMVSRKSAAPAALLARSAAATTSQMRSMVLPFFSAGPTHAPCVDVQPKLYLGTREQTTLAADHARPKGMQPRRDGPRPTRVTLRTFEPP